MDRGAVTAVAIVAATAGGAIYFMHADYAELQKQLEAARRQVVEAEKALRASEAARLAMGNARKAEEEARKAEEQARARGESEARRMDEERQRRGEEAKKALEAAKAAWAARERAAEARVVFDRAVALEREGRNAEAVGVYAHAARAGNGKAALRLGEIYDKGIPGISRDAVESVKWYNAARALRERTPLDPEPEDVSELYRVRKTLFERALALDNEGKGRDAVDLYIAAARLGDRRAAWRLSQIYRSGVPGVSPDLGRAESWGKMANP